VKNLLDWEEDLLPFEEEIEEFGIPDEMRDFVGNALWDENPERIAKAAFEANWRAKEESFDWYLLTFHNPLNPVSS